MNRATTLVLLILLALALSALYWFHQRPPPVPSVRPIFAGLEPDDVSTYRLKLSSGEQIALERQTTRWFYVTWRQGEKDLVDRASEERLQHLSQVLKAAFREDFKDHAAADDITGFELDEAHALSIAVTTGGKETRLLLGKDDPDQNKCFARIDGESSLFRTGRDLKNVLGFNGKDFRYEHLFTLEPSGVDSLEIQHLLPEDPLGQITIRLDRGPSGMELGSPIKARADDARATNAIAGLCAAHVTTFLDDPPKAALVPLGLDRPRLNVTMTSGKLVETVEFGIEEGGVWWAHRAGPAEKTLQAEKGFYLGVSADTLKALGEPVDVFRSRRLIRAVADLATTIESTAGTQPVFRIERTGTTRSWRLTKPFFFPADERSRDSGVLDFLSRLDRTAIRAFLPVPADLGAPIATLHVEWKERQIPMQVDLDVHRVGDQVAVRRRDEPDVLYQVDAEFQKLALCDPMQLRSKRLFDEGNVNIASMTRAVFKAGDRQLIIERAPSGWTSSGGKTTLSPATSLLQGLQLREAKRFLLPSERTELGPATVSLELALGAETIVIEAHGESGDGYLATCSTLPEGTIFLMDRKFHEELEKIARSS